MLGGSCFLSSFSCFLSCFHVTGDAGRAVHGCAGSLSGRRVDTPCLVGNDEAAEQAVGGGAAWVGREEWEAGCCATPSLYSGHTQLSAWLVAQRPQRRNATTSAESSATAAHALVKMDAKSRSLRRRPMESPSLSKACRSEREEEALTVTWQRLCCKERAWVGLAGGGVHATLIAACGDDPAADEQSGDPGSGGSCLQAPPKRTPGNGRRSLSLFSSFFLSSETPGEAASTHGVLQRTDREEGGTRGIVSLSVPPARARAQARAGAEARVRSLAGWLQAFDPPRARDSMCTVQESGGCT
jgi:hypothetical protein